jgi:hypothetical protein
MINRVRAIKAIATSGAAIRNETGMANMMSMISRAVIEYQV